MGLRELINKNPKGVAIALGVVITGCLIWAFTQTAGNAGAGVTSQRYYTIDDGDSYFAADANKIPPFTHDGKEAVRAHVFKCGDDVSVHYMERYTEVGRKAAAESLAATGGKEIRIPDALTETAHEFKRPGDKTWQPQPPGPKRCPDGSSPEWIEP